MKIPTLNEINLEIEKGNIKRITSTLHPNLVKYKYTKACKEWNDTTKFCRGVIFDNNHNLIALPMLKMFNIFIILDKIFN